MSAESDCNCSAVGKIGIAFSGKKVSEGDSKEEGNSFSG